MKTILEQYKKTGFLHHAYLIEGEKERLLPEVLALVETLSGQKVLVNPDVYLIEAERFLIGQARILRQRAYRLPLSGERKFFIIAVGSLSLEASQSLLKIFEEPPGQTHFFLLVPSLSAVLPTLRSRFFVVASGRRQGGKKSSLAREFLESQPAGRFQMVTDLSAEEADYQKIHSLLNELETFLVSEPAYLRYLKDVGLARKYLADRSANQKLLLEHLAVVLPKY